MKKIENEMGMCFEESKLTFFTAASLIKGPWCEANIQIQTINIQSQILNSTNKEDQVQGFAQLTWAEKFSGNK